MERAIALKKQNTGVGGLGPERIDPLFAPDVDGWRA